MTDTQYSIITARRHLDSISEHLKEIQQHMHYANQWLNRAEKGHGTLQDIEVYEQA